MLPFPADFPIIAQQLIEPPDASAGLLDAAFAGAPLAAQPDWAFFPIQEARASIRAILAESMGAPVNAIFLPFRAEEGRYDVVRVRYEVEGVRLDVAQTKNVFSVRTAVGTADLEELATRLLRAPAPVHLRTAGESAGFAHGTRDTAYGLISPEWPHWFDALVWWRWTSWAGFVTIKATGGPTRAVISGDDESNSYWFG